MRSWHETKGIPSHQNQPTSSPIQSSPFANSSFATSRSLDHHSCASVRFRTSKIRRRADTIWADIWPTRFTSSLDSWIAGVWKHGWHGLREVRFLVRRGICICLMGICSKRSGRTQWRTRDSRRWRLLRRSWRMNGRLDVRSLLLGSETWRLEVCDLQLWAIAGVLGSLETEIGYECTWRRLKLCLLIWLGTFPIFELGLRGRRVTCLCSVEYIAFDCSIWNCAKLSTLLPRGFCRGHFCKFYFIHEALDSS